MADQTPPQVFNAVDGSWLESPSSMLAVLGEQFACKSEFISFFLHKGRLKQVFYII